RHIAETGALPVLKVGDYPAAYLEEIKSKRFPPEMPVDAIAYEAHQPPLYYVLATPIYLGARNGSNRSAALALRFFTLCLSTCALYAGYRAVRMALPGHVWLARGSLAMAATLPMHIAMAAGINNDALAELMINGAAWAAFATSARAWRPRRAAVLGLLLGLAFLTKMQSYVAFALVLGALLYDVAIGKLSKRQAASAGGLMLGVAGLVAMPWLVRNLAVYGPADLLALRRHDMVVKGQLTTASWLAQVTPAKAASSFLRTTFQSFWGQFGWMAAPLDQRLYAVLGLFVGLSLLGLAGIGRRLLRREICLGGALSRATAIMLVWVAVTALGYLWWNVRFVQHQGRYLFPALMPIALGLVLGWRALYREFWRAGLALIALAFLALLALGLLRGDLSVLGLGTLAAVGGGLLASHFIERCRPGLPALFPGLGLVLLAVVALFDVVVPYLSP
ncbi:MAG: hypothetical protein H5T69_12140, partial [Chloroflexi bacterium]|nr:hypothetical protein [Chloroflexota bacterium]